LRCRSRGCEFHPDLYFPSVCILISKANTSEYEAYSGFQGTGLFSNLRDLGIEALVVVGLATDYCVKNTVLDALKLGFSVDVVKEAVKAVNIDPSDEIISINEMKKHGARIIGIDDVA
jgi:nicotinamidase/pyrazinamidase